jgi:hypothetical protein
MLSATLKVCTMSSTASPARRTVIDTVLLVATRSATRTEYTVHGFSTLTVVRSSVSSYSPLLGLAVDERPFEETTIGVPVGGHVGVSVGKGMGVSVAVADSVGVGVNVGGMVVVAVSVPDAIALTEGDAVEVLVGETLGVVCDMVEDGDAVPVGVSSWLAVDVAIGVEVVVGARRHPFKDDAIALISLSTVTTPSASGSKARHSALPAVPKAMFTPTIISLTETMPSSSQSPRHVLSTGVDRAVAMRVSATLFVGV